MKRIVRPKTNTHYTADVIIGEIGTNAAKRGLIQREELDE